MILEFDKIIFLQKFLGKFLQRQSLSLSAIELLVLKLFLANDILS